MHAERSIDIAAKPHAVYRLAQDIANWPAVLPHYRFVNVLSEGPNERTAVMAARRGWIPVKWTAAQRLDPVTPRIEFTHLSGWTVGMEVAWIFQEIPQGTRVTIAHDLDFKRIPFAGAWIGQHVIGEFFVQSIAGRTLERMKQIAENNNGNRHGKK